MMDKIKRFPTNRRSCYKWTISLSLPSLYLLSDLYYLTNIPEFNSMPTCMLTRRSQHTASTISNMPTTTPRKRALPADSDMDGSTRQPPRKVMKPDHDYSGLGDLGTLPAEIREMIYEEVVALSNPLACSTGDQRISIFGLRRRQTNDPSWTCAPIVSSLSALLRASPAIHNEVTAIPSYKAHRKSAHSLTITDSYIEYAGVRSAVSFQPWACLCASGKGPIGIETRCVWCEFMFQASCRIEANPGSPLCTAVETLSKMLSKLRRLHVTFSCAGAAPPWRASSWAQWQDQTKAILKVSWLQNLFAPSLWLPSPVYDHLRRIDMRITIEIDNPRIFVIAAGDEHNPWRQHCPCKGNCKYACASCPCKRKMEELGLSEYFDKVEFKYTGP